MKAVVYIHGRGGSAREAEHYRALFPNDTVFGIEYEETQPGETSAFLAGRISEIQKRFDGVILIANSIGAFYCLHAGLRAEKAYLISPVVDMERLILGMMRASGIDEEELKARGTVQTPVGTLSWEYLSYVRTHPMRLDADISVLYGEHDELTPRGAIEQFAKKSGAALTVMKNGEHWFHTSEEMRFLDEWIAACEKKGRKNGN